MNELQQTIENWKDAKYKENLYKAARIGFEEDIARLKNLENGVNTFGGIKVTVANKETWDFKEMPSVIRDHYFKKVVTFKPDNKKIKITQQDQPDLWKELRDYQTLTPKKNAFVEV